MRFGLGKPLVLLLALCAAGPAFTALETAFAAPPAEMLREQGQIIRNDEARRRELERRHKEMLERRRNTIAIPPKNAAKGGGNGTACVQVKKIVLSGATLLSASEKAELVRPFTGKCLSLRRINALLRAITDRYIAKGYSTSRAYLEPQDISSGVLKIKIIEGTIEGIRLNGDTPADRRRVRTAFPGLIDRPLNLRDLEQGLDQLNRLPSSNAKIRIVPGRRPGTSRIIIKDKEAKTWRVHAGVENSGEKSTGTDQYALSLDKDDFLGLNDLFSFNWSADADSLVDCTRHKSESSNFFYSLPFGYWTFFAGASFFDYHTHLSSNDVGYRSTGDTATYSLGASRILHRDSDSKTSAGLSVITKKIRNFLEGERLYASSYDLSILESTLQHAQRILGGLFSATGEYHLGLPLLDAPRDKTDLRTAPKHEFYEFILSGSYLHPLGVAGHKAAFRTQGELQWTPDTLYNSERLNLGSRYTVRGFQHDSLSGDSGGFIRSELDVSILPAKSRPGWIPKTLGDPQIYVGYDAGFIHRDKTDAYERGTLQGLAAGLRTAGRHFSTDICLAHPLDAPGFMKNRDWEIYWTFGINI